MAEAMSALPSPLKSAVVTEWGWVPAGTKAGGEKVKAEADPARTRASRHTEARAMIARTTNPLRGLTIGKIDSTSLQIREGPVADPGFCGKSRLGRSQSEEGGRLGRMPVL